MEERTLQPFVKQTAVQLDKYCQLMVFTGMSAYWVNGVFPPAIDTFLKQDPDGNNQKKLCQDFLRLFRDNLNAGAADYQCFQVIKANFNVDRSKYSAYLSSLNSQPCFDLVSFINTVTVKTPDGKMALNENAKDDTLLARQVNAAMQQVFEPLNIQPLQL